jgi:hypothetical protein
MMQFESFSARQVGTTGHEILNSHGEVVAWAVDGYWAAILLAALNTTGSGNRVIAGNRKHPGGTVGKAAIRH